MAKRIIELTEKEWAVLADHFETDVVAYHVNGTFGNGEEYDYWENGDIKTGRKEYAVGLRVLEKIKNAKRVR